MVYPDSAHATLAGAGEMGALMRSLDWSRSPLGPPEGWPQSLRTSVSTCLNSRFPILLWWGPELVMLYNDAYRPILGEKHPRSMGAPGAAFWPEIWAIIGPMLRRVLEQGEASWSEDQMLPLNRSGFAEECYFTFSYSPIRDESGSVGGAFTAVQETTAKVLSERRLTTLRSLAAATADADGVTEVCERVGQSLEGSRDLPFARLYLLTGDGTSAHLCAHTGLDPATTDSLPSVPLDGTDPWSVAEVIRTGRVLELPGSVRPYVGDEDGNDAPSLVHPLFDRGAGRVIGALVAATSPHLRLDDAYRNFVALVAGEVSTALGGARALEAAKQRAEQLAELDRAKTQFFSNVSHEFRTPLTLMLGPARELLENPALGEGERRDVEILHRNSLRLLRLVNTLLDFSRIEAGRARVSFEPTDLAAFTAELASVFRSAAERAGLTLSIDCAPLDAPVPVDREMWEKIVLNLVSNAFKHTLEGGIRVSLLQEDREIVLEVEDTGTGIPENELPHIFDRFHRVQGVRARSQEGSGIGLALVRELVALHKGTVEVRSTAGSGSTFTVRIPKGTANSALTAELQQPRPTGAAPFVQEALSWISPRSVEAAPTTVAGRVLFADDNADMRDYVERLLRHAGWEVELASDGQAALDAALARPPDLVVSDAMMPGLDGFGLLRELRSRTETREIPFLMLSARAGEEARIEGLGAGADDYLVKPFSARSLVSRVGTLVVAGRSRRATERHRAELYSLFMQAPAPIAIFRGDELVFELVNDAYRQAFPGAAVGLLLPEVLPELEAQGFFERIRRVIRTGVPDVGQEQPARLRMPDGSDRDTFWNIAFVPLREADGSIDRAMLHASEVTDQVLARRQADWLAEREREARALAEEADRRKDEFLAMLAHELRNPLAAISNALILLGRPGIDPEKGQRLRETCERQVTHLVRLVDDLLDVSRITRGKVELRKESLDLSSVVQNAVQAARPLLDARGHRLSVHLAPGPIPLQADPTRLEQVVVNLLSNSAKYTPPGGRISLELERAGDVAVLQVEDNGRGIPPEMLPIIFDPFVQVNPSLDRTAGGLGVGLTLVRRLAELHGGSVSASSEGTGKGARFEVRLPLDVARREVTPAVQQAATGTNGRRVVLVEDSEDVRETLQELIEELGHEVAVAKDGIEGVERVLAVLPEIALVDVGLPGIDGYEVARRVRAAPGGAGIRLVALTGYGGADAAGKAIDAGFDQHLVKPIRLDQLEHLFGSAAATGPAA